jgi:Glycine zipper
MKRVIAILVCAALMALPLGCATPPGQHTAAGTTTGALGGALLGGAIGGLAGRGPESVLIGAAIGMAVGALAGAIIGNYYDRMERDYYATAQAYNYQPTQGSMVRVENVRVEPELIQPGSTSKLVMTYAILDSTGRPVPVSEKRQILSGNEMLKEIGPRAVDRNPGTYTTEQEVTFPKNLPEGRYALKGMVEAGGKSDQRETTFRVAHVSTPTGIMYAIHVVEPDSVN